MKSVPLNDTSNFELISGLWKGARGPLKSTRVLRSTNFAGDGLLDFDDVVELEVENRHFASRQLQPGDIIIECSGGGPKQPVGRAALFVPFDDHMYFSSNFTTTIRIQDQPLFNPGYIALYLHALYLDGATETLQRATTGIRNLDWREYTPNRSTSTSSAGTTVPRAPYHWRAHRLSERTAPLSNIHGTEALSA